LPLLGKGEEQRAQEQLKKAYHMWDAMDNEKECQRLIQYSKEKWNLIDLL